MPSIRVFAPATVANVTCGFDILGFAVEEPGDEIILKKNSLGIVRIVEITGDEGALPLDAEKNSCGAVIIKFLEDINSGQGIDIFLNKKMPLGSGLGSSAASAVAATFAINQLMGEPKSRIDLLPYCMEGERVACGSAHADNVAPGLLGGFVLIRSYDPLDVIRLETPPDLYATIVHPHIEVKTKDAREILRKQIYFKESVRQSGNVAGLLTSDYDLISRSMQDHIVEPIRSILIPGYADIKAAALEQGALGAGISGSGPSIFALSNTDTTAQNIGTAMSSLYQNMEIEHEVYVSKINLAGPRILE